MSFEEERVSAPRRDIGPEDRPELVFDSVQLVDVGESTSPGIDVSEQGVVDLRIVGVNIFIRGDSLNEVEHPAAGKMKPVDVVWVE